MLSVSRVNPTAIFVLVSLVVLVLNSMPTGDYLSDYFPSSVYAAKAKANPEGPTINDPKLVAQVVYNGLSPTAMAFLDSDNILVLEKDEGTVQRILNGTMLQPLLRVNVNSKDERGMLGIAIATKGKNTTSSGTESIHPNPYVFLFFTEAGPTKSDVPLGNRVYKYELIDDNTRLANPTLLLDLPAWPDDSHVGGMIGIGPDNNVYLVVGDQRPTAFSRVDHPDSQT